MYKDIFLSDYVDCIPNKILTYLGFFFLFFYKCDFIKKIIVDLFTAVCYEGVTMVLMFWVIQTARHI